RGRQSEVELGDLAPPKPGDTGAPQSRTRESEVFDFDIGPGDEHIGVGHEKLVDIGPKSSGKTPRSGKSGPKTPTTPPGSDSDVRLVAEGSDDFHLALDSDVKIVDDSGPSSKIPKLGGTAKPGGTPSKLGGPPSKPGSSSKLGDSSKRKSGFPPKEPTDSGVRLVPMDSDSDVKIIGADSSDFDVPIGDQPPKSTSDSDIRLERDSSPHVQAGGAESFLTEEINLDAELRKAEEQKQQELPQAKARTTPPPQPAFPGTSPFELSEADL